MRLNRVALALLLPALLSCGGGVSQEIATSTTSIHELPGLNLHVADRIEAIDLAVDRRGALHLVWSVALEVTPGTLPVHQVFHARGESGASNWSVPAVVDNASGLPRVLATDDHLDLVTGLRLRHHRSDDGGQTWKDLGELLPADVAKADRFDLASVNGTLLVAVLVRPDPPWSHRLRHSEHRQRLMLLRWELEGEVQSWPIADFPPSIFDPAQPRLLAAGSRVDLAVGLTLDERREGAVREAVRLFHLRSADAGAHWDEPLEISLGQGVESEGRIEEVTLCNTPRGLYLFFTGHAVRVSREDAPGNWSTPQALSPYRTTLSKGEAWATSVSSDGAVGRVAWIDHRYRRSERRIWNPLGGLPWSDDTPLWANNDLFTLTIAEVEALLAGKERPEPMRLTAPLSFSGSVRVASTGGQTLVFWSGRRQVGRERASAGAPPTIFFAAIPMAQGTSKWSR